MSSCPPMQADQKVLYLLPERDRRNAVKEIDVKRGKRVVWSAVCVPFGKMVTRLCMGSAKRSSPYRDALHAVAVCAIKNIS